MAYTEQDLKNLGLMQMPDGTWQKSKTRLQPREVEKNEKKVAPDETFKAPPSLEMRKVTIKLFGEPMPKQSVRQGKDKKTGKTIFFQPEEHHKRVQDYQLQLRSQLPQGFEMFTKEVHVRKMHFMFSPLKEFHKVKGKMEAIRMGRIFYKTTKPDMPDNLKKLVNDSMSGIVFKDDSLICTENDVAKYYGIGGCIIIELEGI